MKLSVNMRWFVGIIVSIVISFLGGRSYTKNYYISQISILNGSLSKLDNELIICQSNQYNIGELNSANGTGNGTNIGKLNIAN